MKLDNINNFTAGWLVGNFTPALIHTKDIELGVKHITKGEEIERHYQKVSTEYNYIAQGSMIVNGHALSTGDIFIYEPGEITEITVLEDSIVVVWKTPSLGYDDKVVV